MSFQPVTACVLLIGNELLSGRTQDANLAHLATTLNEVGVSVHEARVIPDDRTVIIETLNSVRTRFDYVFTTGGIGLYPRRHHGGMRGRRLCRASGDE